MIDLRAAVLLGVGTWLGALLMTRMAGHLGLVDRPNARSSHSRPTPRGGGLAMIVAALIGVMWVWSSARELSPFWLAFAAGGAALGLLGLADDRFGLAAGVRLVLHLSVAAAAVWLVAPAGTGALVVIVCTIFIVAALNIFNFMDGIDGIAASEALFAAVALLCLLSVGHQSAPEIDSAARIIAAVSGGFVIINWAPARIFMGDAGSGFLGFVLALVEVNAVLAGRLSPQSVLIVSGTFLVDGVVTILGRAARGERIYIAHRSHAYQHLARRWSSHARVTLLYMGINLVWLLPLALASVTFSRQGWLFVALALGPLIPLARLAGAGRVT